VRLLALLLLVACSSGGDGALGAPPPTPPPPAAPLDYSGWVTASDGTIPVIIVAPHGGDLSPTDLPNRSCAGCVLLNDANTMQLAQEIAAEFDRRIGERPFVVINRLHRSKFDGNRDLAEATGGFAALDPVWEHWQAQIDSARVRVARLHPRALMIDLHGHAHAIPRLELGYIISANQLRQTDEQLLAHLPGSSIGRLHQLKPQQDSGALLVRGPRALGSRLAALGIPAVPSDSTPAPLVGEEYFSGGYNTQRHGSAAGGAVDAIQIECHNAGVRDTPSNRTAFAEALVTALLAQLADYYDWTPPA
jgi:N-formylglutamate amidohydrolase